VSIWRRVLTERRRVVLPLAVLVIANVAVLVLGVLPLQRIVANRQQEAIEALAKLGEAKRLDFLARNAHANTEQAEAGIKTFYADVLPQGFDDAVQMTNFWLYEIATRAGVQFEQGNYAPEREDESVLERMTAQGTLTGDYDGVRRFLHAVENAEAFIIVDRVELAQPNDQSEGRLELQLDVSTYYRRDGVRRAERPR